jgi:hypothetical protein
MVGVGVADDFTGVGDLTGVLDAFADEGLAEDDGLADDVGLLDTDDDFPPPLPEPRARILTAACSAMVTMYEVGLVTIWLYRVSEKVTGKGDMRAYPGKMEASTT